jgi:hypothetical protein
VMADKAESAKRRLYDSVGGELNIRPKTVEEVLPTYISTRVSGPR